MPPDRRLAEARRVGQFGGSYVLAVAAYNAGAHQVDTWAGAYGDPRLPGVDIIDWIETIPFSGTRNHVQRVMEALFVYRARLAGAAETMTIEQDLARGVTGLSQRRISCRQSFWPAPCGAIDFMHFLAGASCGER